MATGISGPSLVAVEGVAAEARPSEQQSPLPETGVSHATAPSDVAEHPVAVVERELDADILLYNGPIDYESFYQLLDYTKAARKRPNVLLILSTRGGNADAAYRIARCLTSRYKRLTLLIVGMCKSAGTLVALAADELIIAESGELGPLDIQLRKRDEIIEFGSGLDTINALDVLREKSLESFRQCMLDVCVGAQISTKTAADIATQLSVGLIGKLYEQIDPIRLAETMRATNIAMHYGRSLAKNLIDNALHRLVHTYPSHGYVIDLAEAKTLFSNVRPPTGTEDAMIDVLGDHLRDPKDDETQISIIRPPAKEGERE